jgi:uncharacterized protein with PIN domain
MGARRCPDCDRELEPVEYEHSKGGRAWVEIDPQQVSLMESFVEELSGSVDETRTREIETMMCPACGLLRQYANLGEGD